ncbi:hypothetical protein Hdeb2414_s0006g00195161 [Helianthus debilis subsp. tardiflorus]
MLVSELQPSEISDPLRHTSLNHCSGCSSFFFSNRLLDNPGINFDPEVSIALNLMLILADIDEWSQSES